MRLGNPLRKGAVPRMSRLQGGISHGVSPSICHQIVTLSSSWKSSQILELSAKTRPTHGIAKGSPAVDGISSEICRLGRPREIRSRFLVSGFHLSSE
jgi:hypothetical protein